MANIKYMQIYPFVALQLYEGRDEPMKDQIASFLIGILASWVLLNVIFFRTIDLKYLKTFFSRKTAPQYTCELYLTSEEDATKFQSI